MKIYTKRYIYIYLYFGIMLSDALEAGRYYLQKASLAYCWHLHFSSGWLDHDWSSAVIWSWFFFFLGTIVLSLRELKAENCFLAGRKNTFPPASTARSIPACARARLAGCFFKASSSFLTSWKRGLWSWCVARTIWVFVFLRNAHVLAVISTCPQP